MTDLVVAKISEHNSDPNKIPEETAKIALLQRHIKDLEMQQNEGTKKLDAIKNDYEKRQLDLSVLNEMVKEKTFKLDEARTELARLVKEVEEKNTVLNKLVEDIESAKKKIESAQGENKGIKLSIEKNKVELEHANKLIELKEDEIKLLNAQLEKKDARKKESDEQVKHNTDLLNEMEVKKNAYTNIIADFASQVAKVKDFLINVESTLSDHKKMLENLIEKRVEIQNFFSINTNILASLKNYMEALASDYKSHETEIQATAEKTKALEAQYEKIHKLREDFEKLINSIQGLSQKLKNDLNPQAPAEGEQGPQPKKSKQKAS